MYIRIIKIIIPTITMLYSLLFINGNAIAQNVAINSTGAAADNSALLDINSTDKGFLITRAETSNIPAPAFGLMTLAPSDSCLYIYNGTMWTVLGGVGANCPCGSSTPPSPLRADCGTVTFTYKGATVTYGTVLSETAPVRCWLDRNLGASQVATSDTDPLSYGDIFQWGRADDLHQNTTSVNTSITSAIDVPGHGDYITNSNFPYDWRIPQNDNLWQGLSGINNPCPTGYRIPTEEEWYDETITWISPDKIGAYASVLKLPMAGYRDFFGTPYQNGNTSAYWSSTIHPSYPTRARTLTFNTNNASSTALNYRAVGCSVRCIKD
ncbi:FISUMP domain-containing protein [Brumimicrobium oceani]|uniref:Fibrobacter succinogenes major paralogous domain-containing protein n=1 Tax=Brumimicrobium oceani TaxID=2100725 RepID=A0A2U2X366_9FLAO|nr:FISUMP domain-containing protein [Brumimicrobium oceani]PWH82199.1 hypothetical protein DIT68_13915 [Brumimicrobium oceani]